MEVNWWRLPGPTRYVQTLFQELRSGKNVVMVFPRHVTSGLREALAERVREVDLWRWRTINATEFASDGVANLLESLHERFVPTRNPADLCTPMTLAECLVGTIVWVENTTRHTWETWTRFLAQYQHACQACDLPDRSLFCLIVVGNPTPPPVPDVALSVWRWEDRVGRLDMTLYMDRTLLSRFPHPLHHKVALAVLTELAGADSHLAERLAAEDFTTIMAPFEFLTDYAASRGWTLASCRNAAWEEGTVEIIDGKRVLHSAAAAVMGDQAEVTRRIWRGQVSVLYPFIEEQRLTIIPKVRSYLRFPIETTFGLVDEAEDLEVGQLRHFLRGKAIPSRQWKLLNLLTEMRHALAHLEPVPPRSLLAKEILHLEE